MRNKVKIFKRLFDFLHSKSFKSTTLFVANYLTLCSVDLFWVVRRFFRDTENENESASLAMACQDESEGVTPVKKTCSVCDKTSGMYRAVQIGKTSWQKQNFHEKVSDLCGQDFPVSCRKSRNSIPLPIPDVPKNLALFRL